MKEIDKQVKNIREAVEKLQEIAEDKGVNVDTVIVSLDQERGVSDVTAKLSYSAIA